MVKAKGMSAVSMASSPHVEAWLLGFAELPREAGKLDRRTHWSILIHLPYFTHEETKSKRNDRTFPIYL